MKWLFYEKETDTRAKVLLIYSVEPPRELIDIGNYITVENVPSAEQKIGKSALPYCNPQTNEFWYEYIDRSLTLEEIANVKIEEQQAHIDELTIMLGDALIGGAL